MKMKELPKDLAARLTRPIPVSVQLKTLDAELEAAKIEERQAELMFARPDGAKSVIQLKSNRRGLPPLKAEPAKRPSNLPKRPVLAANPTVVNPDADEQRFMPQRGRNPDILNFSTEWLIVTAPQLAMRCSKQPNGYILNEDELARLAESIRKSNLEKMEKGKFPYLVRVEDAPSRAAYRPTAFGSSFAISKMPTGKQNDAQRLNKNFSSYDVTDALTLSTIAAGLSVLSAPGYWGEENKALEPGQPVIGRYRMAASQTRTFKTGDEARASQLESIKRWTQIREEQGGLPVVNRNWHLGLMDDEMFAKVHKALLSPIPGKRGDDGVVGDNVWAATLFESHGENGDPDGIIDGVIGSPWIAERDPESREVYYNSGFSAIISEKWGQTDVRMRYVLDQTFHAQIGFRNLYMFVTHNTIGEDIRRVWKGLLGKPDENGKLPEGKRIDERYEDWLHIVYYKPLNSGREQWNPAKPPTPGEKQGHGAG